MEYPVPPKVPSSKENKTVSESYTRAATEPALLEETIGSNFAASVAAYADRPAMFEMATGRSWTYATLNDAVNELARGLLAVGVSPGDRLGVWSPNCAEWVILQYATAKIGVILVNVNPAYRTSELEFVVRQSGMSALVVAPQDKNSDFPAMAREVAAEVPELQTLVFLDGADPLVPGVPEGNGELSYADVVGRAPEVGQSRVDEIGASLAPEDAINLQYTSGTTGFPKGATLGHRNILNNGYFIGELLGYSPEDRVVIPVPFYHCFGMVIGNLNAFSQGASIVLPGRSFVPADALEAVQRYGGTSLYGVPTMFIAELNLSGFADYDLSTLRTGVMAGSPCPVEVMRKVISDMHMGEVAICYGMTETSPVSTMTRVDDSLAKRTETVGRSMPHVESKIVDASGAVVARGEIGELCTRGYSVMLGYWNQPEKTAEAIDAEGWMHTGDLARMDEDGYIAIEGRIKDMVIRGGENIYPREIEEFFYQHPDIQDVQVIGVPDEKYGEELLAAIIMKEGRPPLDAQSLADFARGKLAHYKIPKYVEVRESFPMTVSGKVRKVEMREEAVEKLGL